MHLIFLKLELHITTLYMFYFIQKAKYLLQGVHYPNLPFFVMSFSVVRPTVLRGADV